MAAPSTTPAPRAFALNVVASHFYGLDLAVTTEGSDAPPQRRANVLLDTCSRTFLLQDCGPQPTQQQAARGAASGRPRQQEGPPAPVCLSSMSSGGVGRLVNCLAASPDNVEAMATAPTATGTNMRGSAYLSVELEGCYLAEGTVGLINGTDTGQVAWSFASAPAVGLILGNFIGGDEGGAVRVLVPGASGDGVALNGVVGGLAGLAPRLDELQQQRQQQRRGEGTVDMAAAAEARVDRGKEESSHGPPPSSATERAGSRRRRKRRRAQGTTPTRLQPSLLALDLNAAPTPSTLTVDGWDATRLDAFGLQWSLTTMEALYGGQMRGQPFPLFDLSVCGTPVFGTRSGNWLAVVDTLDPCLTLPAPAFDSVRAWALNSSTPSNADLCATDAAGNYLCRLAASNLIADAGASLPALTFRLRQQPPGAPSSSSSGDGLPPLLALPLSDLLLEPEPSNPNRTLCLIRGPELSGGAGDGGGSRQGKAGGVDDEDDSLPYQRNPIVLGTRALRSLYVVLDLAHHRVGMANKANLSLPPAGYGCAAPAAACVGQDSYNPQHNICEPPVCDHYLFQEPDPSTDGHSCRVRPLVKGAFAVACLFLVAAELLAHYWRAQAARHILARKQRHRRPNNTGAAVPSSSSSSSLRRRWIRQGQGGQQQAEAAPLGAG